MEAELHHGRIICIGCRALLQKAFFFVLLGQRRCHQVLFQPGSSLIQVLVLDLRGEMLPVDVLDVFTVADAQPVYGLIII